MYLKGPDQYRGWFHSSLLISVGIRERAPYRQVLTHGWTLDEQGRPMSKSLGNVILPAEICEKWGADLLRLWVASQDYHSDMRMSKNVMTQLSDAYFKIRNTFRFALGNLWLTSIHHARRSSRRFCSRSWIGGCQEGPIAILPSACAGSMDELLIFIASITATLTITSCCGILKLLYFRMILKDRLLHGFAPGVAAAADGPVNSSDLPDRQRAGAAPGLQILALPRTNRMISGNICRGKPALPPKFRLTSAIASG